VYDAPVRRLAFVLACLGLASCRCAEPKPPRWRRIDVHTHVSMGAMPRAVELLEAHGVALAVQLSGGWPGAGLEQSLAEAAQSGGRFVVFANPPWQRDVPALVRELEEAKRLGARGVKVFKSLGLSVRKADGSLLAVDDPSLDPFFERCGELGLPVAIHTGDPVAFWQPVGPENERMDELTVHPGWSYAGKDVPSWEALLSAFERRVARHPKTTFIGVHFGNAPEDPARVAALLAKHPNLVVDTGARVPELGHRDRATVRDVFLRFPDRVLFGTDLGVGRGEHDLMLGSTGATPPTAADVERFFDSTWRFFETGDVGLPSPTPIQGRWTIDGLALPREVLEKLYVRNAERVLGVTLPP
jgi:predicted TIM-barrel fold metal-dependent hydrolase